MRECERKVEGAVSEKRRAEEEWEERVRRIMEEVKEMAGNRNIIDRVLNICNRFWQEEDSPEPLSMHFNHSNSNNFYKEQFAKGNSSYLNQSSSSIEPNSKDLFTNSKDLFTNDSARSQKQKKVIKITKITHPDSRETGKSASKLKPRQEQRGPMGSSRLSSHSNLFANHGQSYRQQNGGDYLTEESEQSHNNTLDF